jgi:hypothetical protein
MATDMPAIRVLGRLTGADGESLEIFGHVAPHGRGRWTAAHAEAARFLGECIGAGAVLGMVAAMRPRRGE